MSAPISSETAEDGRISWEIDGLVSLLFDVLRGNTFYFGLTRFAFCVTVCKADAVVACVSVSYSLSRNIANVDVIGLAIAVIVITSLCLFPMYYVMSFILLLLYFTAPII